jgi:hypothetical protein
MKHEANFSLIFRHWLKANYHKFESCSFEMKDSRSKNVFLVSELKEEQRNHALACKSDKGNFMRTTGTTGIADYIFLRNAYAYIVLRYPKAFYIIDIDDILLFKGKSLKETDAWLMAIEKVCL